MGLDITAYRGLVKVENPDLDEHGDLKNWEKQWRAHINMDFPERAEDIDQGAVYTFAQAMHFRAGSYSGYGQWRRHLACMAGHPSADTIWAEEDPVGPFVELINFSDCEGVIGSVVCKKLTHDFAYYQVRAQEYAARLDLGWWLGLYTTWRKAFVIAADGGAVEFH